MLGFARETVVGIFGQRGSGKSYTLGAIVESLGATDLTANIGRNVNDRAVLLLDTLNIYQFSGSTCVTNTRATGSAAEFCRGSSAHLELRETEVSLQNIFIPRGTGKASIRPDYQPFAVDTSLMRPEDFAHIFRN